MKTLTLDIPQDVLISVKIPRNRLKAGLRRELALQLYRENINSVQLFQGSTAGVFPAEA